MGLLSQMLESGDEIVMIVAEEERPVSPPTALAITDPSARPCPTCNSYLAWESVYFDGTKRCDTCEPPPSKSLIGKWWGLDGSEVSGFAWVMVPVQERAKRAGSGSVGRYDAPADFARCSRSLSSSPVVINDEALANLKPLHWSAPDVDGWCWGRDSEDRLHMRQRRFVMDADWSIGLQWLTETAAEWDARAAIIDSVLEAAEN